MKHEVRDIQHGGVAAVKLECALIKLGILAKVVPAKIKIAVAEVVHKLMVGSFNIAPDLEMRG